MVNQNESEVECVCEECGDASADAQRCVPTCAT